VINEKPDLTTMGQASKAKVRPLLSTDSTEDLARLRILAFPHLPESHDHEWHSSLWRWLERYPLAGEMHRWVVEAGGEVVGHLAALPQYYRIGGQQVIAHTPAHYMVLPKYSFYAISLMRKFFATCRNCVAADYFPRVISIEKRFGAQETGKLRFWVKVWDLSVRSTLPILAYRPVSQVSSYGLRAIDRALNGTLLEDNLKVEVLEGFDESFDELFESVAAVVPCTPEKDAAFLRWRYGFGSPQAPATVLGVKDRGTLLGYTVLWINVEANGYLLDLVTHPNRRDVAIALLRETSHYFRQRRVRSVRYRFAESVTSPRSRDLLRLGFLPVNVREKQGTLLTKFADSRMHQTATDISNWSYTSGDGELTYWVR
jgi:hypothetical protein